MALDRTYYNSLTDDTGAEDGTPVDKAFVDAIYDAIDALPAANSSFTAHGVVVGNGTGALAVTSAGTAGQVLTSNGASADPTFKAAAAGGTVDVGVCEGRLTLTTAVPVTSADVTAAGTIYFAPYRGSRVALYDGSAWTLSTFTERSLALTLTSGKNYDVFLYNNSGTLTLELSAAWTNDTTRADALTTQDGVYVKSGATTRRYLGTIRASGTNTTEDSATKRFVWNNRNRLRRRLQRFESTGSWTYTTATWRQANAAAANQVEVVIGLAEVLVDLTVSATHGNGSSNVGTGLAVGLDSTSTPAGNQSGARMANANGASTTGSAHYVAQLAIGWHSLVWLEYSVPTGTTTWYSNNNLATNEFSGLVGWVEG